MEAKGRKMLALGIVTMLCAVAIIGIGYAAFAGTAGTYNQGNNVDAGYITMTPDGADAAARWAAISASGKEVFSTYSYVTIGGTQQEPTYTEAKAYYFQSGGSAGTGIAANYIVKDIASKDFVIANNSGAAISAINFKATATAAAPAGDFVYFLKVTIGETVTYLDISTSVQETTAKSIAIANGSTGTISVAICIGYIPNVTIPANHIGPAATGANDDARESANAPADLSAVSFAFEVEDASS